MTERSAARLLGEARLGTADDAFLAGLRRWLNDPMRGCTDGARREAAIVLGELLANAYVHAKPPYAVRLSLARPDAVRLEVHDATPTAGTGWSLGSGLTLVRRLSSDWGVERGRAGKSVWAELPVLVVPADT